MYVCGYCKLHRWDSHSGLAHQTICCSMVWNSMSGLRLYLFACLLKDMFFGFSAFIRVRAIFLTKARFCADFLFTTSILSSLKLTSSTQWSRFSMLQWARIIWPNSSAFEILLEIKYLHSTDVLLFHVLWDSTWIRLLILGHSLIVGSHLISEITRYIRFSISPGFLSLVSYTFWSSLNY